MKLEDFYKDEIENRERWEMYTERQLFDRLHRWYGDKKKQTTKEKREGPENLAYLKKQVETVSEFRIRIMTSSHILKTTTSWHIKNPEIAYHIPSDILKKIKSNCWSKNKNAFLLLIFAAVLSVVSAVLAEIIKHYLPSLKALFFRILF